MNRMINLIGVALLSGVLTACMSAHSQEAPPPPPPPVAVAPAPPPMVAPPPPPSAPYVVPSQKYRVAKRHHRMTRYGYRGGYVRQHCVTKTKKVFNRYSHRYETRPVRVCRS
jgi:hypothetical protein